MLNSKEQKRLLVMNEILAGRMAGQDAAEMLGLSLRHTRRLIAAYRREGAATLAHGNRGRQAPNRLDPVIAAEILRLAKGDYRDYNDSHFTEELAERPRMTVSCSTVRRIRRKHGLGSPRKRRAPNHRRRRQRYPQSGMLLQVDGSKHDWLEGRGPWLTLHAAIDDATNEVPWALFREEEDATGYALLLHHISQTHGLPLALYADRHTIFQSPKEATIEEQLEGLEPLMTRLVKAQHKNRLERALKQLVYPKVDVIDEIGYLPLSREEASLFFRLVVRRYDRASTIVTSNKSFLDWGEIFNDHVLATAVLDRLLHHATTLNIKGESYRLKEKRRAGLLGRPKPAMEAEMVVTMATE